MDQKLGEVFLRQPFSVHNPIFVQNMGEAIRIFTNPEQE